MIDTLRDAAEVHGLTLAPAPSTHWHNTLGGMIGNKPCGVLSVMGGKTVDDVIGLDMLTYVAVEQAHGQTTFRVRVPPRGEAAIDLARRHVH